MSEPRLFLYPYVMRILGITLSLLLITSISNADLDPLSGARTSMFTTQSLLATQPLPSLNSNQDKTTIQASYVRIEMEGYNELSAENYSGEFTGGAIGGGYSTALRSRIGKYINIMANSVNGKANVEAGLPDTEGDFKTSGYAVTGGFSFRGYGKDDGKFILGLFGGPTIMSFKSKLKVDQQSFNSEPFIFGVQVGLQMRFKLDKFIVNPYGIHMIELSDECKKVTSPQGRVGSGPGCSLGSESGKAGAGFSAFGVVMGWDTFQFNVYSQFVSDDTYDDLDIINATISYSW